MSKSIFVSGALAFAMLATPVLANSSEPAPAAGGQADEGETNKVVCRRIESIGTRLGAKKVCRTKAQWDSEAATNRQDLERSQTQRWKSE
jgi:hypothetical protein